MSLVISLTCALLATFLQQWARRYLKITQSRYSPHKRARIRAFFSEGVDKCLLPWTVEALPTLLHISLFLFFAGLVVFLCNVNLTIFKLVLSWVGLCAALYGCFTCMPIIRHDSPYYTPLSLPAWYVVTGIAYLVYRFFRWFNRLVCLRFLTFRARHFFIHALRHFLYLEESCRKSLAQGMQKTAEETALNSPSEIDTRAFMWTFDCLDEDHELDRFFSGLPGFRSSKVVKDPLPSLTDEEKWKLSEALRGLLDRTFSSDLLLTPVKDRRAMICKNAIDPVLTPNAHILHAALFKYKHSGSVATAIANILSKNDTNPRPMLYAQLDIFRIIATRRPFDDSWYTLAANILGFTETSLRGYAAHGHDLSLVILIHFVRLQFTHFMKSYWQEREFSFVLTDASNLDVKDTSPELQHKFCALWNQIVNEVQGSNDRWMVCLILKPIRNVYLALHQDTDSAPIQFSAITGDWNVILREPSSYPVCNIPDHRSDWTPPILPPIYEDDVSMTLARAIPHDPNIPAVVPFFTSPDAPSSSTHAPFPVDETLTNMLPFDNQMSVPVSTSVINQMTTECPHIPSILPGPVTTCAMHGSIDFSRTTEPSTSSPSPKSSASASSLVDIAVGHAELSRAPSGDLNVLYSPSPPDLDPNSPTGVLLFSGRDSI